MRIVVGAATGNTGEIVVEILSKLGHNVVAITREPEGEKAHKLTSLHGVTAKRLEDAFDQPTDRAYLATSVSADQYIEETNFINYARAAGVKYIVKLSTFAPYMQMYTDPFYGRTHLAVEWYLEHGDIAFTCLRPMLFNNFLGVDLDEVKKTNKFKTILRGAALASIDPHDVGRAASALLALPDPSAHYGQRYELTGPEDNSAQTIARDLTEILGTPVTHDRDITDDEIRYGFTKSHPYFPASRVNSYLEGYRRILLLGDKANTSTSPGIAALAEPKTTLKERIRKYYNSQE